jgi:hypothetical protein
MITVVVAAMVVVVPAVIVKRGDGRAWRIMLATPCDAMSLTN